MDSSDNLLIQKVKISDVKLTDEFEGIVTINTTSNKVISAFFWEQAFEKGQEVDVVFMGPFDSLDNWEITFSKNINNKLGLDATDEIGRYNAYGKIISINPIIADFGDIKLNIGDWTNDSRVIGEYIYWKIYRLNVGAP